MRMLITPSISFESESYEPHVIVRASLVADAARIIVISPVTGDG